MFEKTFDELRPARYIFRAMNNNKTKKIKVPLNYDDLNYLTVQWERVVCGEAEGELKMALEHEHTDLDEVLVEALEERLKQKNRILKIATKALEKAKIISQNHEASTASRKPTTSKTTYMKQNLKITIEGPQGSGKTILARMIRRALDCPVLGSFEDNFLKEREIEIVENTVQPETVPKWGGVASASDILSNPDHPKHNDLKRLVEVGMNPQVERKHNPEKGELSKLLQFAALLESMGMLVDMKENVSTAEVLEVINQDNHNLCVKLLVESGLMTKIDTSGEKALGRVMIPTQLGEQFASEVVLHFRNENPVALLVLLTSAGLMK